MRKLLRLIVAPAVVASLCTVSLGARTTFNLRRGLRIEPIRG